MTIVTTRLILFFAAHSAIGAVTCGSVNPVRTMNGERVGIMRRRRGHHDHRHLRFGCDRRGGERERRQAETREHAHLLLHDELLRDALGRLGREAGVVLDDQLDLAAGDGVAVLRHVEPARGFDLLAGRGERAR